MAICKEACIVFGALCGIVTALITPCVISCASEDEEVKKETKQSKRIIVVHHYYNDIMHTKKSEDNETKSATVVPDSCSNKISTEQNECSKDKAIVENRSKQCNTDQSKTSVLVHQPRDNAVHTAEHQVKKSKPTDITHDANGNKNHVKRNIKEESTLRYITEMLEKATSSLLKTLIVDIDLPRECSPESELYEDAQTHVTSFSEPISIHLDLNAIPNNNDRKVDKLTPTASNLLKETLGINNSKNTESNDHIARQSTLLDPKSKEITKYKNPIETFQEIRNGCEFCEPITKSEIIENNAQNITPKYFTPKEVEGEDHSTTKSGENNSQETEISREIKYRYSESNSKNRIQCRVHLSKSPIKKLIRRVKNVMLFRKLTRNKNYYDLTNLNVKYNRSDAYSY